MTKIKQIRRKKAKLNSIERVQQLNLERQERLQELVDEHGIEEVAEAAGYAVSTLKQYLRVSYPVNIGEESVRQAEEIFADIS